MPLTITAKIILLLFLVFLVWVDLYMRYSRLYIVMIRKFDDALAYVNSKEIQNKLFFKKEKSILICLSEILVDVLNSLCYEVGT
ncbi:hypothetical protein J2750_001673 [Methanococcoides alaskense]|uniref:Uncharacterized protein n=1 Tax=Methanococcoides alaskense TaxID=325778 RepID=A0AA90ZD77_9EURY|nr:hypothetical protein [Methanococcoides alaskense]